MDTTVLIVEDDHNIGNLVRTYLQRDGYGVIWVRSGEEGLAELARHAVGLVVLDVGLPGIDGFTVCRRVRESSLGAGDHAHGARRRSRPGGRASSSVPTTTCPSRSAPGSWSPA